MSEATECGLCGGPLPCLTHRQGLAPAQRRPDSALSDLLLNCTSIEVCTIDYATKQHVRYHLTDEQKAVIAVAVNEAALAETAPTKEEFAHWSRAWSNTCNTILEMLGLPGHGSPDEMIAQVSHYLANRPSPAEKGAKAALEQIAIVCTDNMDRSCDHRMALDFVRQIANDYLDGSSQPATPAGKDSETINFDALAKGDDRLLRDLAVIVMSEQTGNRSLMSTAENAVKEIVRLRRSQPVSDSAVFTKRLNEANAEIQRLADLDIMHEVAQKLLVAERHALLYQVEELKTCLHDFVFKEAVCDQTIERAKRLVSEGGGK